MTLLQDSTERFSQRAENYVKYRPHYPAEIIDWLKTECDLVPESIIVDVGSGTGFLAELFLQNGNSVFGVEPNADMRNAGEVYLKKYSNFSSVDGTAEITSLSDHSIDLVTAGQAFHWFEPEVTRKEFKRILKTNGWVVLVWNERRLVTPFQQEYEALLLQYAPEYKTVISSHFDSTVLDKFFTAGYREARFDNIQQLNLESFYGRLLSASYCPAEGSENHANLFSGIADLFERYIDDDKLAFGYDTRVFAGLMA